MTGAAYIELAKLHDEFPILNDVEGTLAFRINEGESKPETMAWNVDATVKHHLARLGITARLQLFLAHLACREDGASWEGTIEFERGHFQICW